MKNHHSLQTFLFGGLYLHYTPSCLSEGIFIELWQSLITWEGHHHFEGTATQHKMAISSGKGKEKNAEHTAEIDYPHGLKTINENTEKHDWEIHPNIYKTMIFLQFGCIFWSPIMKHFFGFSVRESKRCPALNSIFEGERRDLWQNYVRLQKGLSEKLACQWENHVFRSHRLITLHLDQANLCWFHPEAIL